MTDTATAKPKRQSLKDIARRVSTIPPSPQGQTKARPRTPLDSMRPVAVSTPPPPPAERMNELAELCEATAERVRGDVTPQAVVPPQKRKSTLASALPILGGIAVGLGAIALSVVVITRSGEGAVAPAAQVVGAQPAEVTNAPIKTNEDAVKAPEAAKSPDSESDSNKGDENTPAATPPAEEGQHATPPKALAKGPGAKVDGKVDGKVEDKPELEEPTEEQPMGLAGAMADAVGNNGKAATEGDTTKEGVPAAGSVPTTPSQGQVQSALAAVRGAARGCVAGMEAPSRASVTFGPNGSVTGVSVSGAASGKPAASCIQSALRNARVPPFTKSSFTVGLSLRP